MLLNLRLMIVAVMASMLGISCGLGVFAAFHVNRDPILLSPSGTPPLLFSNAGPMVPSEPGAKTAGPFDTPFTVTPVSPLERPLRASAPARGPTPSQVDSVMARQPPESANPEAPADLASTEETKAESTTADAAIIEVTKAGSTTADAARIEVANAESTTANAASTEIAKAAANNELIKAEETKPDGGSKLSLGDSNTVAPERCRAKKLRGWDISQQPNFCTKDALTLAGQIKPVLLLDYATSARHAMIVPHGCKSMNKLPITAVGHLALENEFDPSYSGRAASSHSKVSRSNRWRYQLSGKL
jgi:hypothetical protein